MAVNGFPGEDRFAVRIRPDADERRPCPADPAPRRYPRRALGRGVAHNIFLDGNSDKDSHSVEKRKWVGDLQLGFVVSTQRFRLAYSHVIRTKEFELQRVHNRFGSLTLAMRL